MPEEEEDYGTASMFMQAEEIHTIAKVFSDLGVKKIRLTGGEPLVRKDFARIALSLSELPLTLALTTNGVRLHEFTDTLRDAGIRKVNISLDTLDREKFRYITKKDQFQLVWNNIHTLLGQGLEIKVNVVVMQGLNDLEIPDFIEWIRESPLQVRFIEFMPFKGNHWSSSKVIGWKQILERIRSSYEVEELPAEPNDTSRDYKVPGYLGSFAVISTMSAPFCGSCNRLRLTADGKMKNCLFSSGEMDLLGALRQGSDLEGLIRECLLGKAAVRGGQLDGEYTSISSDKIHNRSMVSIGG